MDALWHAYPHTLIEASGADVGLPDNQMGNSEVGHLTIGAGRIIQQELVRISNTVKENKLIENTALNEFSKTLKRREELSISWDFALMEEFTATSIIYVD